MSAIWAGVANDSMVAHRGPDAHHQLIRDQFGRDSSGTATTDSVTAVDKSRQMSCSSCTFAKKGDGLGSSKYSPTRRPSMTGDDAILGDREYTVHHEVYPLERV